MAKAAESIIVAEVLQRHAHGQKASLKEAQAVTAAAVAVRNEFLNDMFQAMQRDPRTLDAGVFKCMLGVSKLLFLNGLISPKEMKTLVEGTWMSLVPLGIIDSAEMNEFMRSIGMME